MMPKAAALAAGTNNSGTRKVPTPIATAPAMMPADVNPTLSGLKPKASWVDCGVSGCYLGPFRMPGTAVP